MSTIIRNSNYPKDCGKIFGTIVNITNPRNPGNPVTLVMRLDSNAGMGYKYHKQT